MLTEADLLDALRVCYDPEFSINIVDLGRVHSLSIAPDRDAPGFSPRATVTVHLLPRDEVQDAMLSAQIVNRLLGMPLISAANVAWASPAWTAERMTAAGRQERSRQQGLVQLGTGSGQA